MDADPGLDSVIVGLEERAAPPPIWLEMVALGPLVPGVHEYGALVPSLICQSVSHERSQPPLG